MRFPTMVAVAALAVFTVAACGGGANPTGVSTPTASPVGGPTAAASTPVATPSSAPTAAVSAPPTSAPTTPPTDAPTPAATTAAIDLCALLSADDLNTVLGGSWLEGQLTSTGGYCHWDSGNGSGEIVITATDLRPLEEIKSHAPGGVDMTVNGHAGYSVRNAAFHLQTVYVDLGGQSLIVEFPTSSSADDDQTNAQELAEIAIGNL